MPLVPGCFLNPLNNSEIDSLVVWYFLGTEIPYPSSHTNMTRGTCNTPAALIVSQKIPSLVDASPIVVKQTSLPLLDKFGYCFSSSTWRKSFDARANPSERGV